MRRGSGEAEGARGVAEGKLSRIEFRLRKRLCPPEHFALHPHLVYPPRAPCSQPTWTPFCKPNALYWQNMAKKNFTSCMWFPPHFYFTGTIPRCFMSPSRTLTLRLDRNPFGFADRT